ncbi:MAG: hypothetical protein FWH36_02775 [Lentimicrobiaceae bacterium]|nr:hypothetical protein [Lentimicrobiaceae bacterium]
MIKNGMIKTVILCSFIIILGSCNVPNENLSDNIWENEAGTENIKEYNQNKLSHIVYHKERIIIFWCPTEQELNEIIAELEQEEMDVFEDDIMYYNTNAITYISENGEDYVTDTNSTIGFIIQQDTIILNKETVEQTLWKIILFDGKTKPIVIAPIDISDDKFLWFFKK